MSGQNNLAPQGQNAIQGNGNSAVQGNDNSAVIGNRNTVFYGNNNQINFVVPGNKILPQQKPRKKVPLLLPYLINRSIQEFRLEQGIKEAPRSPLICIIYGDEFQSHQGFLERIHQVSLPKFLEQEFIQCHHLPSPPKFSKFDDFSNYLQHQLAEIVTKNRYASPQDINIFFNNCSTSTLIYTHLLIDKSQEKEFDNLYNILKFWQTYPIEINQKLIVCILIKYKIRRKRSMKNFQIIKSLLKLINNFFQKKYYQNGNRKFSQYIEKLQSNADKFNRLSVLVLPELTGVNQGEVEDWVLMEHTQNFLGKEIADRLRRQIRELFDKWEEQHSSDIIPMDDLAIRLMELLESNLSGDGEML